MIFDDYVRIFALACAGVGAIFVIRWILTGRAQLGGSVLTRAADPKLFWLLIAKNLCSHLGIVLAATIVPHRFFGPLLLLSIFAPALAFALLTGRFEWEANDKRIDSPRRFWGWATLYGMLVAFFVVVLFTGGFR